MSVKLVERYVSVPLLRCLLDVLQGRHSSRLVFVLSLVTLLTAASHRTDSLRGLSRWTLAFIMKGPRADFWRRKSRKAELKPSNGTNGAATHEKNGTATQ